MKKRKKKKVNRAILIRRALMNHKSNQITHLNFPHQIITGQRKIFILKKNKM